MSLTQLPGRKYVQVYRHMNTTIPFLCQDVVFAKSYGYIRHISCVFIVARKDRSVIENVVRSTVTSQDAVTPGRT